MSCYGLWYSDGSERKTGGSCASQPLCGHLFYCLPDCCLRARIAVQIICAAAACALPLATHCLHLSACPIWLFFHFISRLFSLLSSTPFLPCYFLASFFAVPRSFFVDFVSLFLHYPSLAICGNISKRCFELMPAER